MWVCCIPIIKTPCLRLFLSTRIIKQTHAACSSPVDVVKLVNRVNGQDHLSQVELGHLLWQTVLKLTEQSQKIPTHIVVHDQVLHRWRGRQWEKDRGFMSMTSTEKRWTDKKFNQIRSKMIYEENNEIKVMPISFTPPSPHTRLRFLTVSLLLRGTKAGNA